MLEDSYSQSFITCTYEYIRYFGAHMHEQLMFLKTSSKKF